MSTVARDGASEEGMSSPKKMRNESDDETSSTASDEDVSSSSDDGISSKEAGDLNESESSEEMYNSDVEADPWGVVIHETADNFVQSTMNLCKFLNMMHLVKMTQRNEPFNYFTRTWKELGNVYMDHLQWMSQPEMHAVTKMSLILKKL